MNPVILYDNLLERGALSSPQTVDPDAPLAYLADGRPYTRAKWTTTGTLHQVVVALTGAETADCIGLAGHNLAAGDVVTVEHSDDGSAWTTAISQTLTGSGDLLAIFTGASHTWWRISIDTTATGNQSPELGVLMLGQRLTFPVKPQAPYVPVDEKVVEESAWSKAGHLLGTVVRYSKLTINAKFKALDRSFVFGDFQTFWQQHARQLKPFFYAWDLDAFPDQVYVVRHTGRHRAQLSIASLVDQLDLQMEGVL